MQVPLPGAECAPLQIDHVSKQFGGQAAVQDVSLTVPPGQCFGLLGPNGAGKTTLIRCIAGRVRPDAGTVRILGEPVQSLAARAAMGWVPQDLALYPRLSVRENLEAFGQYYGLRGKALAGRVLWCLGWAGLQDRADSIVLTLSGGMKRRLNLAIGTIHNPRLLLLDEPTVGVDPQSRNRIFDMVEGLRREGVTVIYTTHYMEEAARLCDYIAIIDHAQIVAQGTKDELITHCFGNQYTAQFRLPADAAAAAWADGAGGALSGGFARFRIDRPEGLASLILSAGQAGLGVTDVSLSRPDLEAVFLHLTGRELRE